MDRFDRLQKKIDAFGAQHVLVHKNSYSDIPKQLASVYQTTVTTSDLRFTYGRQARNPRAYDVVVYICDSHEPQYFSHQQLASYLTDTPVILIGPKKSTKHLAKSLVVESRFYSSGLFVGVLLPQKIEVEVPTFTFTETISDVSCTFHTQKGLFSYQQIDEGTRLLLGHVSDLSARRILDFGCGYGAISCMLAQADASRKVVGVDSDLLAVEYAQKNVQANQLAHRVSISASFLLSSVSGEFDAIICNPPTHTPTDQVAHVISDMRDVLVTGGEVYMVINQAVDYESLLRKEFSDVSVVATSGKYKIVRAA